MKRKEEKAGVERKDVEKEMEESEDKGWFGKENDREDGKRWRGRGRERKGSDWKV